MSEPSKMHAAISQGVNDVRAEAFREGREAVLREVAKLPSPWKWKNGATFPDGVRVTVFGCDWCGASQQSENASESPLVHPANGCLFAQALAVLPVPITGEI